MRPKGLTIFVCSASLLLMVSQAFCDVCPADVIETTNWEKVEGLAPDELLGWIRKGDLVLEIGSLNYEPQDYQPPYGLQALRANRGKYVLGMDDWILERETGKPGEPIIGHPFPEIGPQDPKAYEKMVYNICYTRYIGGNGIGPFSTDYLKSTGFESSTKGTFHNLVMDGNPKAAETRNPDHVEKYQIFLATSPHDIAGTAVMTWHYFDPQKRDNTFVYVPAIRRVGRMSSANRSDALFGSAVAVDDGGGYDGKVTAMAWRFLRLQEALVPFPSQCPAASLKERQGDGRRRKT